MLLEGPRVIEYREQPHWEGQFIGDELPSISATLSTGFEMVVSQLFS